MADDKITLEDALTLAAGGTITPTDPTPPTDPVPPTTDPVPPEGDPVPPEGDPVPPEADPVPPVTDPVPPDPKKSNPMKELREKMASEKSAREKIENTLKKFTSGDYDLKIKDFKNEQGEIDYDAFNRAMEDIDIEKKAKDKGISPEVQAEIERIDKEKIELQKQRLQISMDRALTNLQQEMGLKEGDVNNFFKDAMAVKKNPYQWIAQGGDLKELYRSIYYDRLVEARVKEAIIAEKVKWEAAAAKAGKTPAPNPALPKPPTPNPTDGITLAEALAQAAAKKR